MDNFTINNYEMKRDIINFSKKICEGASKPESKFTMDMIYGISKSKDVLLSSIAGALDENTKKAYTIDRLSDNLSNDLSNKLYVNYDDAGNGVYDVVDFYVSNPENLDSIIQEAKNIKDINWKNFNIYSDDEVYQNTQESVNNSSTLIISLIVIAIIVSISVISIIVFMNIKARKREIGILLSIGKSKVTIVFQFIIEMLIIVGISFTGSYFFSKLIAGSLGNAMGKVAESVIIQNNQFALITGIGIVILLSIVIISCIPIMNKKPRQILSQMN